MSQQSKALAVILVLFAGLGVIPAQAKDYDLVILNGRVMDPESNFDAVRNVGIKDGKIVAVTKKAIEGKETIDASGHVVAPGFIDMHFHNVPVPFGQKLALRDGVTTPMELEAGAYPVDTWYASMEGKAQTNYAISVGTGPVREHVLNPDYSVQFAGDFLYDMQVGDKSHFTMNWSQKIATEEQIDKIGRMIEEGLKQGALGIGHGTGYMEFGVTTKESNLFQELAGKYNTVVFIHGRFSSQQPPTSGLMTVAEQLAPTAVYGGGLVVQHITAQTLDVTPEALQLIDDARAKGIQVIAEIYPYNYGATIAGADYLHPDNYGPNMGRGYSDMLEVAAGMKPLTKERYETLSQNEPGASLIFYNAKEQTVYDALANPNTVLGSDAFPYTLRDGGGPAIDWDTPYDGVNGHPRGAGSHALLLRLSREKKVDIPLSLAVAKMSYLIAQFLQDNGVPQMAHKGRVQVGADADITIFDPNTVTDNATMKNGGLPSTGIPYVVVNGTIVVKGSKVLKGVFPGKPIRLPVQN